MNNHHWSVLTIMMPIPFSEEKWQDVTSDLTLPKKLTLAKEIWKEDYKKNVCTVWLKACLLHGKRTIKNKVLPLFLFQRDQHYVLLKSGSPGDNLDQVQDSS